MKTQASFSELEYATKKKVTRRDRFLDEINNVTPWAALVALIEPFYPKGTGRLLETHQLTERIFDTINTLLTAKGLILSSRKALLLMPKSLLRHLRLKIEAVSVILKCIRPKKQSMALRHEGAHWH